MTSEARNRGHLVLVMGGARSGKSAFAQRLAMQHGGATLFVATGQARDREMASRIEQHRKDRPKGWRTLELDCDVGQGLPSNLAGIDVVIVDCITLLVSNALMRLVGERDVEAALEAESQEAERLVMGEVEGLLGCVGEHRACFIVVSNEVGLGLVPDNRLGRVYRDLLGRANQVLAGAAHEVYFLTAGLPIQVKPAPSLR
ncbi:MAG: bifunctional adenosylcobinamide kinase/adenosylcobinamide-phosphate guanylyltransferase [Chloroflexota bacterium]